MLPGARGMREQLENFDETRDHAHRGDHPVDDAAGAQMPKLLNGSRRLRIAKGSGTTVTEVNQLVQRFEQAAKMMKTVAKGGVPQVPGMGPIPGASLRRQEEAGRRRRRSKSGNPAKRAAENAALAAGGRRRPVRADRASGSARVRRGTAGRRRKSSRPCRRCSGARAFRATRSFSGTGTLSQPLVPCTDRSSRDRYRAPNHASPPDSLRAEPAAGVGGRRRDRRRPRRRRSTRSRGRSRRRLSPPGSTCT